MSDPLEFTQMLHDFHNKLKMSNAIVYRFPLGMLLIDANKMKKLLIPVPISCLKVGIVQIKLRYPYKKD